MNVVIGVIVILAAIFLLTVDSQQKSAQCGERATTAAVETYPLEEYPATAERELLQERYKQDYMLSCE